MKRFFKWMMGAVILGVVLITLPHQQAKAQPGVSVSFQMFYDELSPYGQWMDDPEYGYVWAPNVGNDFRPYYTNGRWVMTEYGNTWISNYNWGWAPFHYGRWMYDDFYGWIWVPGDEWGPAWVSWRSGGGYYGWAPLAPGIGINISFGNYYAPNDWWTFIPCQHIYSPNYYSYWRGPRYNNTYITQTTIINNFYNNRYIYGPRRNEVEHYTGRRVTVYNIRNERKPGRAAIRRNDVSIFRPQVVRNERRDNNFREAPRNVVRPQRTIDRRNATGRNHEINNNTAVERARPSMRNERVRENNQQVFERERAVQEQRRQQVERERVQRENMVREQRERENAQRENMMREQRERENAQRQNQQRIQVERQRAERENMRRVQVERAQRENEMRMQEARSRQQAEQRRQVEMQRSQQQRRVERPQAPQREWRRPEPQRPQRIERSQPAQERERPFRRGR